ncbi:unnamed protein product [Bursaphelenchus okinawaensis]|uniref:Uncharacterized protein n=1 Tax=Bursaphelenchus okinawaensis TaxID=465554 RepID=A0A811LMM3_9BILA|nr:unnamed protein product [Bursaphelenchus okinawaensis]CAG9128143.1 unnamed protein product [Bursaphelenchus okinawaensis]
MTDKADEQCETRDEGKPSTRCDLNIPNAKMGSHKEKEGKIVASLSFFLNLLLVYLPKDIWRYWTLKEKNVEGQTVVITGGASGIGQRMAEIFALDKKANVAILDIDLKKATEVANDIKAKGGKAEAFRCDVTCTKALEACYEEIKVKFNKVDIIICNAAILYFGHTMELTNEQLQRSFNVNVMGVLNTIRTFLPDFEARNQGQIVCMSSICGYFGETYGMAYCPSKFAVRGIMESIRCEMMDRGLDGIKCTTLYPFFVRTPMILDMGMRPTSRFIPFMSVNRCATAAVNAILKEESQRFIPGYICIMTMAKNLMGHHFTIQARRFMNCRYVPTTILTKVVNPGETQSIASTISSQLSMDSEAGAVKTEANPNSPADRNPVSPGLSNADATLPPSKPNTPDALPKPGSADQNLTTQPSNLEAKSQVGPNALNRSLKPSPEANNYYETPEIIGTIVTIFCAAGLLAIIYKPDLFFAVNMGKLSQFLYTLGAEYNFYFGILLLTAFIHVCEAITALYICHALDTTHVCGAKWFCQTLIIGVPSLGRLWTHYRKVRKVEQ